MSLSQVLLLFGTAFLSATLMPGGSEATLLYFLQAGYPKLNLILIATAGNASGAALNYLLGYSGGRWLTHRLLGFRQEQLVKAESHFSRWGSMAIFFSFLPVVGDPITAVAGLLRYPFTKFLLVMTSGKLFRYVLLVLGFDLFNYSLGN